MGRRTVMVDVIKQNFERFDGENPHVFEAFKKFATQVKDTGKNSYSAKSIFERMRWHSEIETVGESFKLCNNYTAHYARKLMNDCPEFEGFFRTKELRA